MRHLEDKEQAALIQWAALTAIPPHIGGIPNDMPCPKVSDFLIAIPNGGLRRKTEAAILKALGVKAGVSDLLLAIPRWKYHGLWIEMKRPWHTFVSDAARENAVTTEQREWITRMRLMGYAATVSFGWDWARALLQGYLSSDLLFAQFQRRYIDSNNGRSPTP